MPQLGLLSERGTDGRRGGRLGKAIVDRLGEVAKAAGCYKVILDCTSDNAAFYERCGYKRKEVQMALYFSTS